MQRILLVIVLGVVILTGCSLDDGKSENEIQTVSSASWVTEFVKWENESYVVTEEEVNEEEIGAEIGEVTFYSHQESSDTSGNFSNKYQEGTKYYEITDINEKEAIAIKVKEGKFLKVVIFELWQE
ncbi:hypothetical protein M3193_09145 [Sporosarcina luteola]|uniref:hypothetical protein n=1 Tax=Sporosarcina luteola TaxID=582850 RepID=UPI00203F0F55|nr:hypothetical protein [Sporosarcina luteola]MCM3744306.1 hypothetical protein [Sporosarcina luteola]